MALRDQIATEAERAGPYIGGGITLAVALGARAELTSAFHASGMGSKDAASAAFNVMVMLTAFLFAVFVLAIAPAQGFLQNIFNTQTFRVFTRYVVEALVVGSVAAFAALPFMTTPPGKGVWHVWPLTAVWLSILVTATLLFFRVVHIFLAWVGYSSRQARQGRSF